MNIRLTIQVEADVEKQFDMLVDLSKGEREAKNIIAEAAKTKATEAISRAFHKLPHTVTATATI